MAEIPDSPRTAKSIRIIDVAYKPRAEPLAGDFDRLTLANEQTQSGESNVLDHNKEAATNDDFLYDIYAVTTDIDGEDSELFGKPFTDDIFEYNSDEFDDCHLDDGEDSDSNSESNWRNDYPDEEDFKDSDDDLSDEYGYRDDDDDDDDDESDDSDSNDFIRDSDCY